MVDPKPNHLLQWALMGRVYAERILNVQNPTIGLLSNGEEPTKGNRLVQEVYPLLAEASGLNFVGNVEGKDIPAGTVDVVVTDGFTGNVALKTAEGAATFLTDLLRQELTATLPRKLAAAFLRPAFRAIRDRLDYSAIGGAPLLGINGTVIIAHGRSNERAIANAVGAAKKAVGPTCPAAFANLSPVMRLPPPRRIRKRPTWWTPGRRRNAIGPAIGGHAQPPSFTGPMLGN